MARSRIRPTERSTRPRCGPRTASSRCAAISACSTRPRRGTKPAEMTPMLHPALYQINTRVWLTELSRQLGRTATLDDVPDAELDRLAAMGFDYIWLLSVWQT